LFCALILWRGGCLEADVDEKQYKYHMNALVSGMLTHNQRKIFFVAAKFLMFGGDKIREEDHPIIEQFRKWTAKNNGNSNLVPDDRRKEG
jgi:hypothetical protein